MHQELLYQALSARIGIVIHSADPEMTRMRLYKARADSQDPALAVLQFRLAPLSKNELWIIRANKVKTDAKEE